MRSAIRKGLLRALGPGRGAKVVSSIVHARAMVEYRLSRDGRRSLAMLTHYRDSYRGKRCFIVGNGPSLNTMDLAPLRDEYTFSLNRGHLLFERLGFDATFLVVINQLVAEQFADELLDVASAKFFGWHTRRYLPRTDEVTFLRPTVGPRFSRDVRSGIWGGATVTYAAMQLAFHMGFRQAILIGVDHSFKTTGTAHQMVLSSGSDPDHFDPDYFGPGVRWELPNLEVSEIAYRMARREWEESDRQIVDATAGGRLTVFPKRDLSELLNTLKS